MVKHVNYTAEKSLDYTSLLSRCGSRTANKQKNPNEKRGGKKNNPPRCSLMDSYGFTPHTH